MLRTTTPPLGLHFLKCSDQNFTLLLATPADHGIYHFIRTSGPPMFSKFRRLALAPDKLATAKKVSKDMEAMGLCQKASSPWSSPLHIVTKKDGTLRPCGDYRHLNMPMEPDHYPLPNIDDITTYLHGRKSSEVGPPEGLLSGPHAPSRYSEDHHHHALWYIHI